MLPAYEDLGRYPFQLPELGYPYEALEPVIDAETMTLHHNEHHQSYVENLNEALTAYPELHDRTLGELLTSLSDLPSCSKTSRIKEAGISTTLSGGAGSSRVEAVSR